MKSMTGYGNSRAQAQDVGIEVSIRTVNGRYLETRFHLPREYMGFEGDLKRMLAEKINRGTVDVFVNRKLKAAGGAQVLVDRKLAKQYLQAFRQLSKELALPAQFHAEFLLRQPDVIRVEIDTSVGAKEEQVLKKVFREAIDVCDRERLREGKALRLEFERLLSSLEAKVKSISVLREQANRQLQERFETRLQSRMKGGELDPQRVSQEIVMQIEKSDINEELSRLQEHVRNYRQILASKQAEGKKLDFYTQELLREVNTIGSKSQVARMTQVVVEAKTLIERLREQVQNVE